MRSPQLLASGTATINMTPMIDVVFLLIIFFLVSSHLAKQENSVELNLPEARSGMDDQHDRDVLTVNVLANGSWLVGGASVERESLRNLMERRVSGQGEPIRLRIRTDEKASYERLEPILSEAAKLGIGDIVFSVYEDRGA
ncbi:MAG: biopolymer transporter ExbD [Planctomycetota bacterium]